MDNDQNSELEVLSVIQFIVEQFIIEFVSINGKYALPKSPFRQTSRLPYEHPLRMRETYLKRILNSSKKIVLSL